MSKLKLSYYLFICLIAFFSCEREIELDFVNEDQSLAVYSLFSPNNIFTNDHTFEIEVSSTQSILDNTDSRFLEDASVTIIAVQEEESPIEERLSHIKSDEDRVVYRTDNTVPQDGFTYKLKVEHEDYPTVIATSFVPAISKISNVELSAFKKSREDQLPDFTRYFSKASIDIENNLNSANHYHLLVWLRFPNGWSPVYIEEDLLKEQLGADATIINVGNSTVFFGAHFDNAEFKENLQTLNFDIAFSLHENHNPTDIKIELRSVSKDYHKYFVEGFRQSQVGDNPFFVETSNISNNIENGYGVFAGYSSFDVDIPFRK